MPKDLQNAGKSELVVERPYTNDKVEDQRMDVLMIDSDSDASENFEEERQSREPTCDESEFEDTELKELVMREGPQ